MRKETPHWTSANAATRNIQSGNISAVGLTTIEYRVTDSHALKSRLIWAGLTRAVYANVRIAVSWWNQRLLRP